MSTDFTSLKSIPMNDLFDGRLESYGIFETDGTDWKKGEMQGLFDGRNYLIIYGNEDGSVGCMTRRGNNAPDRILVAIEEVFNTEIYSEYQPQFWGYETEEDWEAARNWRAEESEARLYTDIINYLNGEPHNIGVGTNGEACAEIAKDLVTKDPQLLDGKNQKKLMDLVNDAWINDILVCIKLTDDDLALAKLAATHDQDLPQA